MRIHTTLDLVGIASAARAAGVLLEASEHGSRISSRAFEVGLEGTGGPTNTGRYGAGDRPGATWDEWGTFFGALYALDPDAVCGGTSKRPVYANADHFHRATGDRFRDGLPADTHKRHRWMAEYPVQANGWHCSKCTAARPYVSGVAS